MSAAELSYTQFFNALYRHAYTIQKTCDPSRIAIVSITVYNGGFKQNVSLSRVTHANALLFWYNTGRKGWDMYLLDPHGMNPSL